MSLLDKITLTTKHPKELEIGQSLFFHMTHAVLLKVNERAKLDGNNDPLADILSRARDGSITAADLAILNTRVVNTMEKAMQQCHPGAIFITSTHKKIAEINAEFRRLMVKNGSIVHRLVCTHVPNGIGHCLAADDLPVQKRQALYGVSGNTYIHR